MTKIGTRMGMRNVDNPFALQNALNKIYVVRKVKVTGRYTYGLVHLPEILAGKSIKIILVEETQ